MKMFDLDSSITVEGKDKPIKARDPNAQTMQDIRRSGAAGAHKDKTKVIPRKEKYKKMAVDEQGETVIAVDPATKKQIDISHFPGNAKQKFDQFSQQIEKVYAKHNVPVPDFQVYVNGKLAGNIKHTGNPYHKSEAEKELDAMMNQMKKRQQQTINNSLGEADPAELGPMNDKMKDVLGKVHAGDEAEKQAEIDRAEKIRQQQVKDLGPEAMEKYVDMLKSHDWTYQYSDDHSVWQRGQAESDAISGMMKILDPDMKIYKKYSPFHDEEKTENTIFNALNQLDETATAGATSSGNIATVANPHIAIGNKKARDAYGKKGMPANPPKAKPIKPTDNALDMKGTSIFGGSIKRNM